MDQLRTEPWLTEEANVILQKIIDNGKNLRIFEYGMGASTIWFAKQPSVEYIYSVEHEQEWFDEITRLMPSNAKSTIHVTLMLKKMPYNNAIESAVPQRPFDIILVDGRNRNLCIQSSIKHLAENGVLILDNSEREYYAPGISLMNSFQRIETCQHEPDKYGFTYPGWSTTFFFKNGIPKSLSLIK
jgi:predicted O-methyltransferase YrrM